MATAVAQAAAVSAATQAAREVFATRYLNGIGVVVLLYDCVLTFDEEVRLVWMAKRSFLRFAFILNKYLVLSCLIGVDFFMNDWSGPSITDVACRRFWGSISLIGITSITIANILMSFRVIDLWDKQLRIKVLMASGILLSFLTSIVLLSFAMVKMLPDVHYDPGLRMCFTTVKAPEYPVAWGFPFLYEAIVLICICWNALDRPRRIESRISASLHRDGFTFYSMLTLLRLSNLIIAIAAPPSLVLIGCDFVWSMTTLVFNRSMLNILGACQRHEETRYSDKVSLCR